MTEIDAISCGRIVSGYWLQLMKTVKVREYIYFLLVIIFADNFNVPLFLSLFLLLSICLMIYDFVFQTSYDLCTSR